MQAWQTAAVRNVTWARVALVLFLGLPVLAIGTWWRLLGADWASDPLHVQVVPSLVWRPGDAGRGDLIALEGWEHPRATVLALPGDRLSLAQQPAGPWLVWRLTATWEGGEIFVDVSDLSGALPAEVPQGSVVVFGDYMGTGGDSGVHSQMALVGREQVRGVILDDWRGDGIYAVGTAGLFAWLVAASFTMGRLGRRPSSHANAAVGVEG